MPVYTPTPAAAFGSFILSDGERTQEFVKDSDWADGIYLVDFKPPVPVPENTYAEGADSEGRRRVRTRYVNPIGTGLLRVVGEDEVSFWDHADNLQELITSAHRAKGTITYDAPRLDSPVTLDLVSLHLPEIPHDTARRLRLEIPFEFECLPFGRLDPVVVFTGEVISGPIDTVSLPDIPGHVDARGELTVTDTSTQNSDHIEVGVDDGIGDVLLSDAELVITGFAGANATISGSYATNTKRATLTTTPVVICSTGAQPHLGRKKIRTRVYASADGVLVRLAHKVGDGRIERGRWITVPAALSFYDLALAIVNIAEVPSGTHEWTGYIEAKAATPGTTLAVDTVEVFPAEPYAKARVPFIIETPSVFSARDEFDQVVGGGSDPLTGLTAPTGGVWVGAGDADDFVVEDTGHTAQRSVVSDADVNTGRFAVSGVAAMTTQVVEVDVKRSANGAIAYQGLLARYTDVSNWFKVVFGTSVGSGNAEIRLYSRVGGSTTNYGNVVTLPYAPAVDTWYTLRLFIDATGQVYFWVYLTDGAPGTPTYQVLLSVLATGGALASGKPGFYDVSTSATQIARNYDNFAAWVPTIDHALYSGQSATLTHESYLRENTAGTREGKLAIEGDYLRIPPATRADRISRLAIRRRRYDNDGGSSDLGIADAMTADLSVTPRVLLTG